MKFSEYLASVNTNTELNEGSNEKLINNPNYHLKLFNSQFDYSKRALDENKHTIDFFITSKEYKYNVFVVYNYAKNELFFNMQNDDIVFPYKTISRGKVKDWKEAVENSVDELKNEIQNIRSIFEYLENDFKLIFNELGVEQGIEELKKAKFFTSEIF